jgi:formylglycine-generating enzyme
MRAGRWIAVLGLVVVLAGGSPASAEPLTYEMVTVGNAGNANDTTGYGGVAYEYRIGKYDVTIGQYTEFLNFVDPHGTNPFFIYDSRMGTDLNIAGISFTSGAAYGTKYAVMGGSGNRPITYVSWFSAARFANWMHWMLTGQGAWSTEYGVYNVEGQTGGTAPAKNAGATYWIPTENEWYKAAYHHPQASGGPSDSYWAYATQSDTAPANTIGSAANQANYFTEDGFSFTQSSTYSSTQNYLTDVGAFAGNASFYGTFDQNGLVYQWNDLDGSPGSSRGLRGGDWSSLNATFLSSANREMTDLWFEGSDVGFRLAGPASLITGPPGVPEIDRNTLGSVLALVTGALGLIERRRLKVA